MLRRSMSVTSIAARAGTSPDRRLAGRVRGRGRRRSRGEVATHGDASHAVRLASVSKPVAALAVLVAAEEGVVDLDEAAGPPGSTVRHLLAHTVRPAVRGHGADRAARASPHLLERGVPRAGGAPRRSAPRCRSPTTCARPLCRPLGIGLDPSGDPGSGMHALTRATCWRSDASSSFRDSSPTRRATR